MPLRSYQPRSQGMEESKLLKELLLILLILIERMTLKIENNEYHNIIMNLFICRKIIVFCSQSITICFKILFTGRDKCLYITNSNYKLKYILNRLPLLSSLS